MKTESKNISLRLIDQEPAPAGSLIEVSVVNKKTGHQMLRWNMFFDRLNDGESFTRRVSFKRNLTLRRKGRYLYAGSVDAEAAPEEQIMVSIHNAEEEHHAASNS